MTRNGPFRGVTLVLAALALAGIALAGCGRKGPLERPPAAKAAPPEDQARDATVRGPRKPFILDRLLQ
jgi:predicted small lipoprotein YifL